MCTWMQQHWVHRWPSLKICVLLHRAVVCCAAVFVLVWVCWSGTIAIGVMATVSAVELWWHSAVELQDFGGVTAAVAAGAALFALLDPLLPKPPEAEDLLDSQQQLDTSQVGWTAHCNHASPTAHRVFLYCLRLQALCLAHKDGQHM